jgi:hypothetical protein
MLPFQHIYILVRFQDNYFINFVFIILQVRIIFAHTLTQLMFLRVFAFQHRLPQVALVHILFQFICHFL